MTKRFEYEGQVRLGCQEGGFADWSVDLVDYEKKEGDLAGGIHNVIDSLFGGVPARTLGDALLAKFETLSDGNMGHVYLGRVKITIEQIEPPEKLPEVPVKKTPTMIGPIPEVNNKIPEPKDYFSD